MFVTRTITLTHPGRPAMRQQERHRCLIATNGELPAVTVSTPISFHSVPGLALHPGGLITYKTRSLRKSQEIHCYNPHTPCTLTLEATCYPRVAVRSSCCKNHAFSGPSCPENISMALYIGPHQRRHTLTKAGGADKAQFQQTTAAGAIRLPHALGVPVLVPYRLFSKKIDEEAILSLGRTTTIKIGMMRRRNGHDIRPRILAREELAGVVVVNLRHLEVGYNPDVWILKYTSPQMALHLKGICQRHPAHQTRLPGDNTESSPCLRIIGPTKEIVAPALLHIVRQRRILCARCGLQKGTGTWVDWRKRNLD